MGVELAAGAVGIAAYRHQSVRWASGGLQSRIAEIRIGGDEAVLQSRVMLRHERAGHHVYGQLSRIVAQVGSGGGWETDARFERAQWEILDGWIGHREHTGGTVSGFDL